MLDEAETGLDPQNPNPRGVHGSSGETDPLDLIIRSFNEKHFQGWEATPEEQRIKFVSLAQSIKAHPDFEATYAQNPDFQNRNLAFKTIMNKVMNEQRKKELDLYRLYIQDNSFQLAFEEALKSLVGGQLPNR